MRYFFVAMGIIIMVTLWVMRQDQQRDEHIIAFYHDSCVAMPGQTSVMKWVDGKATCTRYEEKGKHGNNLKDWRE